MRAVIRNGSDAFAFLTRLRNEYGEEFDKPLTISVRPFQSFRNLDQNAKCHAMIRELAEWTGYAEREMKEILKAKVGPMKIVNVGMGDIYHPKGTSEYTIQEMSDFIERLYQLGAEIGCVFSENAA